jgi:hypothetical protein
LGLLLLKVIRLVVQGYFTHLIPVPVHTMLQAHPWFKGVPWDMLYEMDAAFKPEVNGELDTQNFEKFEEVDASKS